MHHVGGHQWLYCRQCSHGPSSISTPCCRKSPYRPAETLRPEKDLRPIFMVEEEAIQGLGLASLILRWCGCR